MTFDRKLATDFLRHALRTPRRRLVVLGVLLGVWALSGIRTVGRNEEGVVTRFGRVTRTCPAGAHLILPWPIERMQVVLTSEVRTMAIGLPLGDVGGDLDADAARWLTGDTNVVEIQLLLQYMIRDPVQYLYRVADLPDGHPREFALGSIGESVLTVLLARLPVDDVLSSGKGPLGEESRRRIQEVADRIGLGVEVLSANVVKAVPPAEVISAFNDVTSARADHDRLLSDADGFAKELLPKARADADRIGKEAEIYRSNTVSEAEGSASSFLALAAQASRSPAVSLRRLWLESMEKAIAGSRKVVYAHRPGGRFHLTAVQPPPTGGAKAKVEPRVPTGDRGQFGR